MTRTIQYLSSCLATGPALLRSGLEYLYILIKYKYRIYAPIHYIRVVCECVRVFTFINPVLFIYVIKVYLNKHKCT
jgi:hypothetical protein